MQIRKGKRYPLVALLCVAAIPLLWFFLLPGLSVGRDLLEEGSVVTAERGQGSYGPVTEGPGMNLKAGRHTLEYAFETDGTNTVRLVSDNGVDIVPPSFTVSPGNSSGKLVFLVFNETDNFRIEADYEDGSFLRCDSLTLRLRACTDPLFTVSFLLAIVAFIVLFGRRILQPSFFVILLFSALAAGIPCYKQNLGIGDDMLFHLERLSNLTQGLWSGQFPVRLGTYMNQGYGSVVSAFYPETFLYVPALMIMGGASIQFSVHAFLLCVNLFTAFAAYLFGRRVIKDELGGILCGILYSLAVYRLTDLYTRSAVGESLAMAFLPLFAAELYEVFAGDVRKWPWLALAAAALVHSHFITAAIVSGISLLLFVMLLPQLIREKRWGFVLSALALASLLCLCLAGPLYTYSKQGVSGFSLAKSLSRNALAPAQLFLQTGYDLKAKVNDASLHSRAYEIGVPLAVSALLAFSLLLAEPLKNKKPAGGRRVCVCCLALGCVCAFLSTSLFPWGALPDIVSRRVSVLQFPWRLLMITDLAFSFCGAWALTCMVNVFAADADALKTFLMRMISSAAALVLCLLSVLPLLTKETRKNDYVQYHRVSQQGMIFMDYSLPGTDSRTMDGLCHEDRARILAFERAGTNMKLTVTNQADARISLPVFAFDGWEAKIGEAALPTEKTEENTISISIPEPHPEPQTISVRFVGKTGWKILDLISFAALLFACVCILKYRAGPSKGRGASS